MTLVWDYANRLSSDTQDIKDGTYPPHTVNYTYGADGKVVDMDVDGSTNYDFLFNYDGMGRLEKLQHVLDSSTDYQYYYDKASNVTKRHNWVDQGTNVTFTYDNLNRISERDIYVPTTQIARGWFSKEHYGYDAMNRLTSVLRDEDAKSDTFTYHPDGEMSGAHYGNNAHNATYNLDKCGNRTSSVTAGTALTFQSNVINQYTTIAGGVGGGGSLTYTGGHSLAGYGGASYYYIGARQLVKVVYNGDTVLLYYDALGRCVRKSLNGVSTYHIFDHDHWINEYNSSNQNTGNTYYGRGIDEVISQWGGHWFFPDRNGNTSVVVNAYGGVLESYRYDAFGTPSVYSPTGVLLSGTAMNNNLLFTGREWNPTFGYEYRARAYDPYLGRFITEDPKAFDAGDYNLYRYCDNDPLDKTDAMGLDAEFTLMRDPYDAGANPRLSAGTMRITENGRFVAAIRVNENGFCPDRQGIPQGKYVVLPKREDGASFKKCTPAVTSPELRDKPGATTAGHPEGSVLIHGEGPKGEPDSKACLTCNPAGLKVVTDVFNRNKDSTTLDVHNGPKVKDGEPEIRKAIPVVLQKEGN